MTILRGLDLESHLARSDYAQWERWPDLMAAMEGQFTDDARPRHAMWCKAPGATSFEAAETCSLGGVFIKTALTRRVADLIGMLVRANRAEPNRVATLVIQGDAHIGKSLAVQKTMLDRTRVAWGGPNPPTEGLGEGRHRHVPWFYVEVGATTGPVSLLVEICRFGNIPADENTRPGVLMDRLRTNFRRMGTEGIFVDDAHGLVATKDGKMTNQLKYMITGLPVLFVWAGMDLSESALLDGTPGKSYRAARQIEERAVGIDAGALGIPARGDESWQWALKAMASRIHMPDGRRAEDVFTSKANCNTMYDQTGGKLGTAAKLIGLAGQLAIADAQTAARAGTHQTGIAFAEALTRASGMRL